MPFMRRDDLEANSYKRKREYDVNREKQVCELRARDERFRYVSESDIILDNIKSNRRWLKRR